MQQGPSIPAWRPRYRAFLVAAARASNDLPPTIRARFTKYLRTIFRCNLVLSGVVCLLGTRVNCAKMDEPIEMPFCATESRARGAAEIIALESVQTAERRMGR